MLKKQIRQQEKVLATEKDSKKRQQATEMLAKLEDARARNDQIAKNLEQERQGISGINYRDTNFGGTIFGTEGESLGARKRLSSGQDYRDVYAGGGVDTGMTTGEMIVAGTILAATGVATGGGSLGAVATATGATSTGIAGVTGGLAMDVVANMGADAKESTKESKKQTDELEDINKTLQSTQAGSNFAGSDFGNKFDYSGGTTTAALQKLGEEAKSKGTSKDDLREALENAGFSKNNIGKVMSGYGDGFSFWRNGKLTSQPIASQDDAVVAVGREGGSLKNLLGGGGGKGNNTFNFYGGSTAEIVAYFENLQNQGVV